jgi:uncharacterized protein (UPF0147 family)
MDKLQQVLFALQELADDISTPKNVKEKITTTIKVLNTDAELSIKVSKALHELEDITEDSNVQAYTRTQLFNIVSLLEFL